MLLRFDQIQIQCHYMPNCTLLYLNLSDFFRLCLLIALDTKFLNQKKQEHTSKSVLVAKLDNSELQVKPQFTLDIATLQKLNFS